MADSTPDVFTASDRDELIKQSIVLDQIVSDIVEIKKEIKEETWLVVNNQELLQMRINILEDSQIVLKQNIKFVIWVASFVSGIISAIIVLSLHYIIK